MAATLVFLARGGHWAGGSAPPDGVEAAPSEFLSRMAAVSPAVAGAILACLAATHPPAAAAPAAVTPPLPRTRRRLIIDVGANSGNSYTDLKANWVGVTITGKMSDYEVYLLEPNPIFRPYINKLVAAEHAAAGKDFITYMPVAGGVETGVLPFHLDPSMPRAGRFTDDDGYGSGGSSLLGGMPAVDPSNPANPNLRSGAAVAGAPHNTIQVQVINLAAWMEQEVEAGDEVHLKVDVEGAEYMLMQRLLPRGILCLVDHLYMELHAGMLDASTDTSLHGMGRHEETIFWALKGCAKQVHFHRWS